MRMDAEDERDETRHGCADTDIDANKKGTKKKRMQRVYQTNKKKHE